MKNLIFVLFLFVSVFGFGQTYTDSLTSKTYIDVKTVEYWMVRYINQERINAGLDTLVLSDKLDNISNTHSAWMCKTGKYEHSGLNVFEVCMKSGSGANSITHKRVAEGAVIAWMSSPAHKSIIIRKDVKYIGSGFAYSIRSTDGYASFYYTVNIDY